MARGIAGIQEILTAALAKMPGVFSTVQWGGRAYKVGTQRKFKLLAHVYLHDEGEAVGIGFKLSPQRARQVVDEFDWIEPHSFRTLAPSGWLTATVRTKAQCKAAIKLLAESRAMYPKDEEQPARRLKRSHRKGDSENQSVIRRLDRIVAEKRSKGWSPRQDGGFEG